MNRMDTTGRTYALKLSAIPTDDLIRIVFLTLLLLIGVAWVKDVPFLAPLRFLLGSIYVLYLPGYCLTAALFPHATDLDPIERVGLNTGFSVALIPVVAWILDQFSFGLQLWAILLAEYLLISGFLVIALLRRAIWAAQPSYLPPSPQQPRGWLQNLSATAKVGWLGLIGVLLVTGVLLYLQPVSATGHTTEFYMVGAQNRAEGFPQGAVVGQPVAVTVGIVNEAHAHHTYHIEVWVSEPNGTGVRYRATTSESIALTSGERWQFPLTWMLSRSGYDQQIEIVLFIEGQTTPYRRLQFWMEGIAESESDP